MSPSLFWGTLEPARPPGPTYRQLWLIARTQRALTRRNRQQCWIKLHECRIDSGVLLVAGVAVFTERDQGRRPGTLKTEERPVALEAPGVLDVHLHAHDVAGLELPVLIDGTLAGRDPRLQHQQGPVRPGAAAQELAIGRGLDEHIVKHGMAHHGGAITHVDPRAQENPLAIVGRKL